MQGAYSIVPHSLAEAAEACKAATGFAAPLKTHVDDDDVAGAAGGKTKRTEKSEKKKEVSADEAAAADAVVYKEARTCVVCPLPDLYNLYAPWFQSFSVMFIPRKHRSLLS